MIAIADGINYMAEHKDVDLILTDPPHLDAFDSVLDHYAFANAWVPRALAALSPGGCLIHSCGSTYMAELEAYLTMANSYPDQIVIWPHEGGFHYFLVYRRALQERVLSHLSKPDKLWQHFILQTTNVGQLVLDPFCGRGEVPQAASATGRRYRGCDVDPLAAQACWERGL